MEAVTPLRAYTMGRPVWRRAVRVKYYDVYAGNEKLFEVLTVPSHLRELAAGLLYANAYVEDPTGIENVRVEEDRITVELAPDFEFKMSYLKEKSITPLELVDIKPVVNGVKLSLSQLVEKAELFLQSASELPSAAVSDTNGYLVTASDISPENAFYKAVGRALFDSLDLRSSIVFFSDFLTPDTVVRCAYMGIPVVGSLKPPTDLAVSVADSLGITLFTADIEGLFVFTHPSRVGE